MNDIIKKILSSSCTPAQDLLVQVEHHGLSMKEATDAYMSNIPLKRRPLSLRDAAQQETAFEQYYDI